MNTLVVFQDPLEGSVEDPVEGSLEMREHFAVIKGLFLNETITKETTSLQ